MAARAWGALAVGAAWLAAGGAGVAGTAAGAQTPLIQPPTPADYAAIAALPDWSGVWDIGPREKTPEPSLTPAAAAALAAFNAAKEKGENLQTESANCVPPGMPQIMRQPYPIEFVYSPGRVNILAETYSQVRRIYTDGRPLPDDPDPAFNGYSTGHWEGDTLQVETTGLNPRISLMAGVHPTEKTLIRETYRLDKPDEMRVVTVITDPAIFAAPFEMAQTYRRKRDWQIREYVCQENNRDAADAFGRPSMNLGQ